MKVSELFEQVTEDYIPDTVRELIDNKYAKMYNGKLYIADREGCRDLLVLPYTNLVQNREIIFPLADFPGDFECSMCGLKSFKNFPTKVVGYLTAPSNNFRTFEGITSYIGALDLSGCELIESLLGIHKHILECDYIILPPRFNKGGLGLLKIKGLEEVKLDNTDNFTDEKRLFTEIITKHLKTRNILACQEDLIDNDLKDFAEL
jgi:hypothetical protein